MDLLLHLAQQPRSGGLVPGLGQGHTIRDQRNSWGNGVGGEGEGYRHTLGERPSLTPQPAIAAVVTNELCCAPMRTYERDRSWCESG